MYIDELKINVKKTHKGKVVGIASIEWRDPEFDGWRIVGFKIITGKYDEGYSDDEGTPLFVAPPAYSDSLGKFCNIFFTAPAQWKVLQSKILESFSEA